MTMQRLRAGHSAPARTAAAAAPAPVACGPPGRQDTRTAAAAAIARASPGQRGAPGPGAYARDRHGPTGIPAHIVRLLLLSNPPGDLGSTGARSRHQRSKIFPPHLACATLVAVISIWRTRPGRG